MWRDRTIKPTVLFQTCRPGAWEPETPEEGRARIPLQGNLCESFLLPSSSLSSDWEALRLETTNKMESKSHRLPSRHPGNTVQRSCGLVDSNTHRHSVHCQCTGVLSILAALLAQHLLCSGDSTRRTEARTEMGVELRLTR